MSHIAPAPVARLRTMRMRGRNRTYLIAGVAALLILAAGVTMFVFPGVLDALADRANRLTAAITALSGLATLLAPWVAKLHLTPDPEPPAEAPSDGAA